MLAIAFAGVELWTGDNATVPPRILKKRSIAFGTWFVFCLGGSFFLRMYNSKSQALISLLTSVIQFGLVALNRNVSGSEDHLSLLTSVAQLRFLTIEVLTPNCVVVYFIPIWFQAIKGVSAVESGIRNLPMILGLVIVSIITGVLITVLGYYTPWMILSSLLMAMGAGLMATFKVGSGHSMWIGYQALYGFGVGAGMQQGIIAAQTVCTLDDIPTATGALLDIPSQIDIADFGIQI